MQTPFHAYYTALKLNSLQDDDRLLPVFSEGKIRVYPYQAAAARFAVRNPYQKGVILCDEAGMGKSHEAMLVISQCWYEGKTKILIAIPNPDLLVQWSELIEEKYSIPHKIMQNAEIRMQNAEIKLPCKIAFYLIKIYAGSREIKSIPLLVGVTEDNRVLTHSECEDILSSPVYSFEEQGDRKSYWLKSGKSDKMDSLINLDEYVKDEEEKLTPMQREEIDKMKLAAANKKNSLRHSLDGIELDMKQAEKEKDDVKSDRLKLLIIERKISALKNELLRKKEGLFFDEMQIDVDLENQINEFLGREKITARAVSQFVVEMN